VLVAVTVKSVLTNVAVIPVSVNSSGVFNTGDAELGVKDPAVTDAGGPFNVPV